jgi:hypothetical protein
MRKLGRGLLRRLDGMYKKLKVESFQLRENIRILLVHKNWKSLKRLLKRGKGERLQIFDIVLTAIPLYYF